MQTTLAYSEKESTLPYLVHTHIFQLVLGKRPKLGSVGAISGLIWYDG
jgi:hypothetical protein